MESSIVILETPELQKTIEEINDEIEPKTFTQANLGLENKPRDLTLPEIFDKFNNEKPKPSVFNYIREPKVSVSNSSKIKKIEVELNQIGSLLASLDPKDPDYSFCQNEFSDLILKLEKIQEKSKLVSIKHSFPKTVIKESQDTKAAYDQNVTYELSLTEVEDRNRLSRLENKIREIEFVLGTWKQSKPVSEALSEFILKTKFFNLEFLERLKEQAKHLGVDLDIILSNDTPGSGTDNSKEISELSRETLPSLSNIPKLSLYLDRLKSSYGLFNSHSAFAKRLLNIEMSSENILGSTSHSLIAQENLREGLEENLETIRKSLRKLQSN